MTAMFSCVCSCIITAFQFMDGVIFAHRSMSNFVDTAAATDVVIFVACYTWLWLGSRLVTLNYVIYIG